MAIILAEEPHHDGSPLYVSHPAPEVGDVVRLRVRVPASGNPVDRIYLRCVIDREARFIEARPVGSSPDWHWWESEVPVAGFEVGYRFLLCSPGSQQRWLNQAGIHELDTRDADDFRIIAYPAPPKWAPSTVMYQIFPDRFARSSEASLRALPEWAIPMTADDEVDFEGPDTPRQYFGGDLRGIQDHLDHLERLGVTMLYLTPFFPGRSNHRYDAVSFATVDPLLGGDDALIELVTEAKRRGLRVMGDLTTNHSGDAHEWFLAALGAPNAVESDFYYWLDPLHESYVAWYDVPAHPKLNWRSTELRRRFIDGASSVVAKWLAPPFNLDGWRVDVANMTGRYLTDDFNAEVRQSIRRTMAEVNPDTLLIAESTIDATSDLQGDAWHGAMTYAPFTRPLWNWLAPPDGTPWWFGQPAETVPASTAVDFYRTHRRFIDGIPWRVRLGNLNALDTHDTPRFLTRATTGALPVALGLSMTMPGIPMIFAGDEFALVGANGEHSRTPIPWDAVDTVAETIDLYAALIRLRTSHPALSEGGMRWLHVSDDVVAFIRETAGESILVVASSDSFTFSMPSITGPASPLYGAATIDSRAGVHTVSGIGPSFSAWSLPGVDITSSTAWPEHAAA